MTIDAQTGAIAWTPTEEQGPGQYVITVRVTDSNPPAVNEEELSVTGTFTVEVNEVNHPPVLEAIADVSQHYSEPVSIQAVATDPDLPANPLTFSLDEAPPGMTIDPETGLISWTPEQEQIGTYTVVVRVTDDNPEAVNEHQLSDSVTFEITISGEGSSLAISPIPGSNLMQLSITGDIGLDYELQISSDFETWETLITLRLTASPHLYIDPGSATAPIRFYRLKIVQ
jgi:hypothetical protein